MDSAGLWITGTCSGGEVGGEMDRGVSSRSLRPSSTGGASHSVTTSTSSSDGKSALDSFGGGSSVGLWTLCRTTPAHGSGNRFKPSPPPESRPKHNSSLGLCKKDDYLAFLPGGAGVKASVGLEIR